MTHKVHYLLNGAAYCGEPRRRSWTSDPLKVTCERCKKLMEGEVK